MSLDILFAPPYGGIAKRLRHGTLTPASVVRFHLPLPCTRGSNSGLEYLLCRRHGFKSRPRVRHYQSAFFLQIPLNDLLENPLTDFCTLARMNPLKGFRYIIFLFRAKNSDKKLTDRHAFHTYYLCQPVCRNKILYFTCFLSRNYRIYRSISDSQVLQLGTGA